MKVDSLSRLMVLCAFIWGVPVAAILLSLDYMKGTLDASLALNVSLTSLAGGAIVGAALWYTVGRQMVAAKRRQAKGSVSVDKGSDA